MELKNPTNNTSVHGWPGWDNKRLVHNVWTEQNWTELTDRHKQANSIYSAEIENQLRAHYTPQPARAHDFLGWVHVQNDILIGSAIFVALTAVTKKTNQATCIASVDTVQHD